MPDLQDVLTKDLSTQVHVWDKDMLSKDDFEGQAVIPILDFIVKGQVKIEMKSNVKTMIFFREAWIPLTPRPGKKDKVSGEIKFSLTLEIDERNREAIGMIVKKAAAEADSLKKSTSAGAPAKPLGGPLESRKPTKKGKPQENPKEVTELMDKLFIINAAHESSNLAAVQQWIKENKDINLEFMGQTPLHKAAEKGGPEMVKLLCASGSKVDAGDKDNWTPLLQAVVMGQDESAEMLLDYGADPNTQNKDGDTPVSMCVHMEGTVRLASCLYYSALLITDITDIAFIKLLNNVLVLSRHHSCSYFCSSEETSP